MGTTRTGRRAAAALAAAALAVTVAACSDDSSSEDGGGGGGGGGSNEQGAGQGEAVEVPETPAGEQLSWMVEALADDDAADITEQDYAAHFSELFQGELSRDQFVAQVEGPLELVGLGPGQTPHHLRGTLQMAGQDFAFTLVVDSADPETRIEGFMVTPTQLPPGQLRPAPGSWDELDGRLNALAPEVGLTVAEVDAAGSCEGIHGVEPDTPRPLASTMKLWVLGAVAEQVRDGTLAWDDEVTVDADLATLPSGVLQNEPGGSTFPVDDMAQLMISVSDNTATDHLIDLVGREAVEAQLETFGMEAAEANTPFLSIGEAFALELVDYPALADRWLAADEAGRRDMLESPPVAGTQFTDEDLYDGTLDPATLEEPRWEAAWQASPNDVCRAFAGLQALAEDPALAELDQILGLEDGGLGLDEDQWETTWHKGGSQGGVLTLSYLATHTDGRSFVVSLALADPERSIDPQAQAELISLAQGAFTLAAGE